MTLQFPQQHGTMLLKYSGISFISGAVNHGFFSGERSLWTAGIGVVLFVWGLWLEHRNLPNSERSESVGHTVLWGTLLSIGLGFFTGGLQHFPDSPGRSAWVVPLGFAISVAALIVQHRSRLSSGVVSYATIAGVMVLVGSAGAWQWLVAHPIQEADHHASTSNAPVAQVVGRTLEVTMTDSMRFLPEKLQVKAGESVKIVARNAGQLAHELVVGTEVSLNLPPLTLHPIPTVSNRANLHAPTTEQNCHWLQHTSWRFATFHIKHAKR
jgi:plastocyanin